MSNGLKVIAVIDRLPDGSIDPTGCIHFQTWRGLMWLDDNTQPLEQFLNGLGNRPVAYILR